MTRHWRTALALVAGLAGGTLVAHFAPPPQHRQAEAAPRPRLALLTSLPLMFGEQFGLDAPRPAAMARIERDYDLVPIAVADAASLKGFTHLLMAHPRAQPAESLVELDAWVRRGGQVVLLADPVLAWESSRMLGDPLRPPPDFADTGLLAHWGVRTAVGDGGEGRLSATRPQCTIANAGLTARCRVGRGTARIIADADFLMGEGDAAEPRLALLIDQLAGRDPR